jgi:thiol:disulfide interchange protein DsbC
MNKFLAFAIFPATIIGLLAFQDQVMQPMTVNANMVSVVETQELTNSATMNVASAETLPKSDAKKDVDLVAFKQMLEAKLPGISVAEVVQSPYENMYEVYVDGEILYATKDGGFLIFSGQLIGLEGTKPENLTQKSMAEWNQRQAPKRAEMIADMSEKDMVIFPAANEKHVVTVFTDVDCGYCRKMHSEMAQYNDEGITVRYLAYPRAGKNSDAYDKLVSIWCANDRNAMMTKAKNREEITMKKCAHPIDGHMKLVGTFGLSGTPAVIAADGNIVGGYVDAKRLKQYLDSMSIDKS